VSGVTSSNTVTPAVSTTNSGTQTIASGSLAVSLDSSSPSYNVASGGTTGVVLAAYKFRPTNDAVNLSRIGLKLTSGSANDLTAVTLWANGVQIGSATFLSGTSNATSTLTTQLSLTKDQDTVITVKGDLADIGVSQLGVEGDVVKVDIDTNGTNTQGTGANSSGTISATGSTSVAGVRVYNSFPTFSYSTTGATLTNGANDLLTLTVMADAKGAVTLNKLTFTVSTTTVLLTAPTFSGPNGNVSSSTNVIMTPTASNPSSIIVYFDSSSNTQDATISAGQTKTYVLRGTVSGLTGSNSGSVSVALKGDTTQATVGNASAVGASFNNVWSPDASNTPASVNDNDWTNNYGLQTTGSCYATAGLGNDCATRVLSK
jgi:hypothetical protein